MNAYVGHKFHERRQLLTGVQSHKSNRSVLKTSHTEDYKPKTEMYMLYMYIVRKDTMITMSVHIYSHCVLLQDDFFHTDGNTAVFQILCFQVPNCEKKKKTLEVLMDTKFKWYIQALYYNTVLNFLSFVVFLF